MRQEELMTEVKNQKLLDKALSLLPDLIETRVEVKQTVEIFKNDNIVIKIDED